MFSDLSSTQTMSPTGGKRNNDEAEGAGDNSDIHNISDELVIDVKMEEEYEYKSTRSKASFDTFNTKHRMYKANAKLTNLKRKNYFD